MITPSLTIRPTTTTTATAMTTATATVTTATAIDHGHAHDQPEGWLRRLAEMFVGHSHDPGDSIDDALTSSARGIRALKVSLLVLGLTAVAQLAVVLVSGSVALLADTIHNFSDALTAIPLWIAFAIGGRAATRRYTFGYRRAEDLAGLFVLLMIAGSALLAAYESISRLIDPQPITNIPIVLVAGLIGFAGNELVALYRIRVGRSIGSAALVADGYHARTDGLTSLAVVAGALGVAAGYPLADPLVGLLITAVILVVLKQATGQMLGRLMDAVEPELVDEVETIAASVPGGPVRGSPARALAGPRARGVDGHHRRLRHDRDPGPPRLGGGPPPPAPRDPHAWTPWSST